MTAYGTFKLIFVTANAVMINVSDSEPVTALTCHKLYVFSDSDVLILLLYMFVIYCIHFITECAAGTNK